MDVRVPDRRQGEESEQSSNLHEERRLLGLSEVSGRTIALALVSYSKTGLQGTQERGNEETWCAQSQLKRAPFYMVPLDLVWVCHMTSVALTYLCVCFSAMLLPATRQSP